MNKIFGFDSPIVGSLTKIGDIICLSALWILFSLPVFTMGASTVALYTVAYRYLRGGKGSLWKTFWKSFRSEFKRATLVWLVALAVMALLTADVFVFRSIKLAEMPMGNLYWVAIALWCAGLTWSVYLAAYTARINGTIRETFRFGYLLIVLHPIRALGVVIALLGGLAIVLMVPFMMLAAPAVVMLICSIPLEKIFLEHQPSETQQDDLYLQGEIEELSDDE